MKDVAFKFETFQIKKAVFDFLDIKTLTSVNVEFTPSGILNKVNNTFELSIVFLTYDSNESETEKIHVESLSIYSFKDKINNINEIPEHFYSNSIAIFYPYLRAFVSTLTLQANLPPFVLPTLNLTKLGDKLKNNISIKE